MAKPCPSFGSHLVARWEGLFARHAGHEEPFLDCDEAANILGEWLIRKGIPFEFTYGHSNEGSSHVWVVAEGLTLDPTQQGCNP